MPILPFDEFDVVNRDGTKAVPPPENPEGPEKKPEEADGSSEENNTEEGK